MTPDSPTFDKRTLTKIRAAVAFQISAEDLLEDPEDLDVMADFIAGQLIFVLRRDLWKDDGPPAPVVRSTLVTWSVPATWWQHVKQQFSATWWLGWLARRRPPVMVDHERLVTLRVDAVPSVRYPDIIPGQGRAYRMVQWRNEGIDVTDPNA